MVNIILGSIMCVIGAVFFILSLITKITGKEIPIFKYLIAKSSMLWKDKAVYFLMISGLLIIVAGVLYATSHLWSI